MVSISVSTRTEFSGSLNDGTFFTHMNNAGKSTVNEILMLISESAKNKYKALRKEKKAGSAILNAFVLEMPDNKGMEIRGMVYIDPIKAPHAIYVERGHYMVNGVWWPKNKSPGSGYDFMKDATIEVGIKVPGIVRNNLNKVPGLKVKG
jgi:hypothetical protein